MVIGAIPEDPMSREIGDGVELDYIIQSSDIL